MKTILQDDTRADLIRRIQALDGTKTALWGKMNVVQMVKHCIVWEEMAFGKKVYQRSLLGYLFGKMALRSMLKEGEPLRKGTPTHPNFVIDSAAGDVSAEKAIWISWIENYPQLPDQLMLHPFFGHLRPAQIGILAYKHADHHLRQFGC